MSSSWEIQEDRFDDVEDSEGDDKCSNYEDDLYIDEHQTDDVQKLNEAVVPHCVLPRLSTITEESNVNAEGNELSAQGSTYADSVFGPSFGKVEISGENIDLGAEDSVQFERGGVEKLQHDQELFLRHKQLMQDDYRYSSGKENSWEPSIHLSPPPVPEIRVEELAALNSTNSHLMSVASPKALSKESQNVPSAKPVGSHNLPSTTSQMCQIKKSNRLQQNAENAENFGPKMSTPKSTDNSLRSLRDLSMNCISSIHPETISPKPIRGTNTRGYITGSRAYKICGVEEEPSLTSSAIDRVLERENFENDDALVDALMKAKTRPQMKSSYPETIRGEHFETKEPQIGSEYREKCTKNLGINKYVPFRKVITKYDHSGINNKTKRLKTMQELNTLRESSLANNGERFPLLPETNRDGGISTTHSDWKIATNSNTTTISPFPFSRPCLADAETQGRRFLSCDQSFVYFGFVDVKCRVNRTIRLRNISFKSLNLKLRLHSSSKGFELMEQGIVVLKPNEVHTVHVVFEPPFGACFQNILRIKILNAEHTNYSIPLLGSGGVASLRVTAHCGLNMLRDGSFVLTAQGVTNISFDIENKGLRDAFVRLVVLDKESKRAMNGCVILPSDCVSILHRTKQKFTIEVLPSSVEGTNHSSRSLPTSFTTPTMTGSAQYYVQLLWGEEAQRRRLKKHENEKGANLTFNGYTFTKCSFLNEEKCKSTASERASYGSYDRDAFELGLRITLISVVDNRLSLVSRSSLPREQVEAGSVILEPDATLCSTTCDRSIVEDVSTIFASSRLL